MQRLPSLRTLQALEAFGRLGSATAAAAELGVTVGAISQQLRLAEEAVGLRLIERRGKAIALTARGRRYHADIKAGFDKLREAQTKIERTRAETILTLSCPGSLASKWIGGQLVDWQNSRPAAQVRLIGADAEPDLDAEGVDFRLSYGAAIKGHDHWAELFTDWVVPACAPSIQGLHDLRKPADVLDMPLLGIEWSQEYGVRPGWADWAAHIGAPHRKALGEVAFFMSSAAIDAAINGRGLVLAQMSMAADDIKSGRLVVPFDIRLQLPQPYSLAWDAAALDKPFGVELRRWIRAISRRQHRHSAPQAE